MSIPRHPRAPVATPASRAHRRQSFVQRLATSADSGGAGHPVLAVFTAFVIGGLIVWPRASRSRS
jgi:hypothetical protein